MAKHRHKRETNARRALRAAHVAAPAAVLMTVSAVGVGVLAAEPAPGRDLLAQGVVSATLDEVIADARADIASRSDIVSRSSERTVQTNPLARSSKATKVAMRQADEHLWSTAELNLWNGPGEQADQVGLIEEITKLLVTGRRENGRAEIVRKGQTFWVNAEYLAKEKPDPGPSMGGTCTNGSSVEAGRQSLYKIHDVVCANWPEVTSYGTWRGDGEHGQGRAMDIMVSGETGWVIAEFLRANYAALGIEYLIYSQKIWSVERGGEGWRSMSDRGSTTANHYDHVHVTVY